ncbi:SAV_915 family protein [Kitasatospora phosalacinea]|uniref:SAV_915 family protein n=1 Tax=Kitasatospora phosalacinea TaxID=2065 RepID=UPI00366827F1
MPIEDEAPEDPCEHPLRHVPVRTAGPAQVLRLFRDRDGTRCAVAFSTAEALHAVLGPDQECAEVTGPALRALTEPLGVHRVVIDPALVAAPVAGAPVPAAVGTERELAPQR